MLVKRAYKVQIPCHRKFQCSFHGLRAEARSLRTILEPRIKRLRQIGAEKRDAVGESRAFCQGRPAHGRARYPPKAPQAPRPGRLSSNEP
jgi:hypothetical protein